jgi:signal transduction histidine kinase
MIKRLLFYFFLVSFGVLQAQQRVADSLEALIPLSSDLRKIELLNEISKAYWRVSLEKSKNYAQQALVLAEKIRSRKGIADSYNRLGNVEYYSFNYDKSLEYFDITLRIRSEIEDYEGLINSHNNIAVVNSVLGNITLALESYLSALEIATQIDDKMETARFLVYVGSTYATLHKPALAIEYINRAKDIYESLQYDTGIAEVNMQLGRVNYELMNFNAALEYYLLSYKTYEENSNTSGMASVYRNIGTVYWMLDKMDIALDYFLRSHELYKTIPGDIMGNAGTLNNIGATYHLKGNLAKALEYYNQVLRIYIEVKNESDIADVYHNIGMVYMQMDNYDQAIDNYNKSVEINIKRNNLSALANNYNNVGELYLLKKEYDTALEFLQKSVKLAEEIKAKEILMENYLFQSRIFSELNNFQKALEFHHLHTAYKDSIFNTENQNKVLELQVRFEAESRLKEIDILKKDNQLQEISLSRKRNERYFFILTAFLTLVLALIVHSRFRFKQRSGLLLIEKNKELENINDKLRVSESNLLTINATKDKFFSIIAHDLKNPFNALLSFSEMLRENLKAFKQDEIRAYVDIIQKATNNLYRLLDNLLQWSSTQTGKLEFHPENFDLNQITDNIIQIMSIHADKKGIKLANLLPKNIQAYGDKNLISTVIRNLISNAVKFTHENGEIKIEGTVREKDIEIAVTDNGIGINQVDLDKLFRLDYNVSTIGTSEEKGTGLGLILCKEFVEKNGGTIRAESEPGKGSSFMFTIPKTKNTRK